MIRSQLQFCYSIDTLFAMNLFVKNFTTKTAMYDIILQEYLVIICELSVQYNAISYISKSISSQSDSSAANIDFPLLAVSFIVAIACQEEVKCNIFLFDNGMQFPNESSFNFKWSKSFFHCTLELLCTRIIIVPKLLSYNTKHKL